IVLLLFFSAAEIIETTSENGPINTIKVMNAPRDAVPIIRNRQRVAEDEALRCDTQADFERYLKLLNALSTFFAHSYKERRVLASGLRLDQTDSRSLQRFAALDQTKVQLVYDKGTSAYNLYALSPEPKVAFCFYENNESAEFINAGAAGVASRRSCFQSVVDAPAEDSTRPQQNELPIFFQGPATVTKPSRYCEIYNRFIGADSAEKTGEYPRQQLRLHIRSVGEIFQFLGDLLHYQDEVRGHLAQHAGENLRLNSPVTFGFCGDRPTPGCNDVFIRLDGDPCNVRFTLVYREKEYRVANFDAPARAESSCPPVIGTYKDHTLEILSVLHQLVGLNKSATEVRTTPFVQVVP
ncbi:MAG TPA: hypothetical protein VLN59_01415, partial [Burkholderiales bacterium]|nr:hypothetical protein [Burkholderiales bacterium]